MILSALRSIYRIRCDGEIGFNYFKLLHSKFAPKQVANICSKQMRDPNIKKPAPWPYKEKKYTFLHGYIDNTLKRFDENTKVVVVDGNIAAGKTTFAKSLARELDMEFIPEANMDMYYINDYGYDLRELDPVLPNSCKSCDLKTFYRDPYNSRVAFFQFQMYILRYQQYIDALAHLLNTGQGVVMDRSIYSDFVFLEAMHKFGFISSGARSVYYDIKKNTISELLRPHLVVYLDIPVDVALERIKKRNRAHEINTKVLSREYLEALDFYYKQHYLKDISTHAELLVYDWSNFGDVEVVVEDIERIDFDKFEKYDPKMQDWRLGQKWDWNNLRRYYTNEKPQLLAYLNVPRLDVPELLIPAEDYVKFRSAVDNAPGQKYHKGYNSDAGDTGLLFKTYVNYRDKQKPVI